MIRWIAPLAIVLSACVSTPAPTRAPSAAASTPRITSSPAAASPTRSPTASPTATPLPQNVRLGLVLEPEVTPTNPPRSLMRLRTEADAVPFASVFGPTTAASSSAVSPDGTRLAYWSRPPGASTRDFLTVLDLFTGVATEFTDTEGIYLPVGVAWRDDGGGLLFAMRSRETGPGADPPPALTKVGIYTFATRQLAEVKQLENGRFLPLSWNLAAHVVAGVDSGEGGVRKIYRFKEDGTSAGDTPTEQRLGAVTDASKDATLVLAQFGFFTGGRSFSGVRTYSAVDPRPIAEHEAADGFVLRARFRPASRDVVALIRVGDPSRFALEIWSGADLSSVTRVWNGPTAPVGSGDLVMRIDGKAAYVRMDQAGATGPIWQVIELASGSGATLAMPTVPAPGPWSSFYITDEGLAKLKKP